MNSVELNFISLYMHDQVLEKLYLLTLLKRAALVTLKSKYICYFALQRIKFSQKSKTKIIFTWFPASLLVLVFTRTLFDPGCVCEVKLHKEARDS